MEPLSTVIYTLFRGTPQHAEWVISCLEGAWVGILGERLASACRPSRYSEGRLTIAAVDPQWQEALQEMRSDLAARIRESTAGEVREVAIVLGGGAQGA